MGTDKNIKLHIVTDIKVERFLSQIVLVALQLIGKGKVLNRIRHLILFITSKTQNA